MIKELKIDIDLRDLLPPLTPEEFEQLDNNINIIINDIVVTEKEVHI